MTALFPLLLSAVNSLLAFLVRSVLVKFAVFFGLFFVTSGFIAVLLSSGLLPNLASVASAMGGISAGVWYWLDLFNLSYGLNVIFSAYVARFIIRRIPLIG